MLIAADTVAPARINDDRDRPEQREPQPQPFHRTSPEAARTMLAALSKRLLAKSFGIKRKRG